MRQFKRNQHGFSVVETLLVLIILLLIGFIGYYVYTVNDKSDDVYDATRKSTSQTVLPKKADKTDQSTAIKAAVIAYQSDDVKSDAPQVTIAHNNDSYALGTITSAHDANGSWFAQKKNGAWIVVSQGAESHCDELEPLGLGDWDNCSTQL